MATKAVVLQLIEDSNLGFSKMTEPTAKSLLRELVNVSDSLEASAALNFPSTAANASSDLTIAVVGAALGDIVTLGIPHAAMTAGTYTAWVSAVDVVTVRFVNNTIGAIDPASATFKVRVK